MPLWMVCVSGRSCASACILSLPTGNGWTYTSEQMVLEIELDIVRELLDHFENLFDSISALRDRRSTKSMPPGHQLSFHRIYAGDNATFIDLGG